MISKKYEPGIAYPLLGSVESLIVEKVKKEEDAKFCIKLKDMLYLSSP